MKKIIKFAGVALTSAAIVAMPVLSASAEDANSVITTNVGSVISIQATNVNISVTPTSSSAATGTGASTVTVSTNNATGYNLAIKDADANTSLVNGGNNITAHTGTFAGMTPLTDNTWGYNLDAGTNYAGVTAAAVNIKTTNSVANNDVTTVTFGAKVNSSLPNGNYVDTVVFTALAN